jgi:hypothetical protein
MGMGLSEASAMAGKVEEPDEALQRKIAEYEAAIAELADTVAMRGEWMWAMARSVERGKPFYVYAYTAPSEGKWLFDVHIENPDVEHPSEPPCFGWNVPHIYVPVGEIFIAVYNDCKKLLGLTDQTTAGEDV